VASSVDSRVIIDQPGAERLLGKGDMLYQAPDAPSPVRMQGAFVSEGELGSIVGYWKQAQLGDAEAETQAIPPGVPLQQAPLWEEVTEAAPERDELFDEAVTIVRQMRRGSVSLLQRRLRIGYTRSARLVDQLEEERKKSATIDTTQIFFNTPKTNFVIIDSPGHLEFIKNMLTGASLAEAGILIVDAEEGIKEQTKRHAFLLNFLGIDKVIVVINKMDLVNYKKSVFESVKKKLLKLLNSINITPVNIIPVSAKLGENITRKSKKTAWCKESVLLNALDNLCLNSENKNLSLKLPIQDVYKINKQNIIVGKIAAGSLKKGQIVKHLPSEEQIKIKDIKIFPKSKNKANKGENVGLIIKPEIAIKRGDFLINAKNKAKMVNSFTGNIFWLGSKPLKINQKFKLRCSTQETTIVIKKILTKIDPINLKIMKKNVFQIKANQAGQVIIETAKPILVEQFDDIPELGRFVLEKNNKINGVGIIK